MDAIAALLPSVGLLVLFILLMRSILHADRRERRAAARAEAEHRPATGAEKAQDSSGAS